MGDSAIFSFAIISGHKSLSLSHAICYLSFMCIGIVACLCFAVEVLFSEAYGHRYFFCTTRRNIGIQRAEDPCCPTQPVLTYLTMHCLSCVQCAHLLFFSVPFFYLLITFNKQVKEFSRNEPLRKISWTTERDTLPSSLSKGDSLEDRSSSMACFTVAGNHTHYADLCPPPLDFPLFLFSCENLSQATPTQRRN